MVMSCSQVQKVSDAISKPSAREVFERELKDNDTLFSIWNRAFYSAKSNKLELELPATIYVNRITDNVPVLGYTISLEMGEQLIVASDVAVDSLKLLIDVFEFKNDSVRANKPIISNAPDENRLAFNADKDATYKLLIQPALGNSSTFSIKIYTQPTMGFPVVTATNKSIQSFWGASRSGGARAHEGVDIFAKRGTPAIAATNGFVSSTGDRGLGGKQVWLRDGFFGQSLYYAHLDSIAVKSGAKVKLGDTLGFVGNTGNARTTSPHLHFGIYTSSGAINPLPFIKTRAIPEIEPINLPSSGFAKLKTNELRIGPSVSYSKITDLNAGVPLAILAKHKRWLHVKVADTLEGFMHETLIKF